MNQNEYKNIPAEQPVFSPSRNPYETLPGFIKGWAITDIVFAGLWCAAALAWWTVTILMIGAGAFWREWLVLAFQGALAALAGGLGLYGNILLLSRKPRGVTVGKCLIILTMLHILWNTVQILMFGISLQFYWVWAVSCVLVTAGRITLLVFYWIAIARAARYFEARRQRIGF